MLRSVEVHVPGLGAERHELIGEQLSMGTGPTADIRVAAGSLLELRHLELAVGPDGVLVKTAREVRGGIVFEGTDRAQALVPWGDEIFLGSVRITFLEKPEMAERPSPVLLGLAPIALLLIGVSVFKVLGQTAPSMREVEAPVLLDEHVQCPERDPVVAEHRAHEAERAAQAKAERFQFAYRDGVSAARLFQESRACFEYVKLSGEVSRLDSELALWTGRMNEEYAAARLRLRVAIDHRRYPEALAATKELTSLLASHDDGPYIDWLSAVRRELEQNLSVAGS